jgi:hypothetical protein
MILFVFSVFVLCLSGYFTLTISSIGSNLRDLEYKVEDLSRDIKEAKCSCAKKKQK